MNRRAIGAVALLALITSGCATGVSEVRTNSGGSLDCPSGTILYSMINPIPESGDTSPTAALALLGDDLTPPGVPEADSAGADDAVFIYRDSDGYRRGRVILVRSEDVGWLPRATERCG